jgi:hypothetical protein
MENLKNSKSQKLLNHYTPTKLEPLRNTNEVNWIKSN